MPDDKQLKSIANSLEIIEGNLSASCQHLEEIKDTLKELVKKLRQIRKSEC